MSPRATDEKRTQKFDGEYLFIFLEIFGFFVFNKKFIKIEIYKSISYNICVVYELRQTTR